MKAIPHSFITTFFSVGQVIFSRQHHYVRLLGVYGNLLNGSIDTIEVEAPFDSFYSLLHVPCEDQPDRQEVIEVLLQDMSRATEDETIIDLTELGGIDFHDWIFSFMPLLEEGEVIVPEEAPEEDDTTCFVWVAHLPKDDLLPDFLEWTMPKTAKARQAYYQQLLAMRWHFYKRLLREQVPEGRARLFAQLTDPFVLAMAETYGRLQQR
jgi:hypothetical protein